MAPATPAASFRGSWRKPRGLDDISQAELYARYAVSDSLGVTLDFLHIANSGRSGPASRIHSGRPTPAVSGLPTGANRLIAVQAL